MKLAILSAIVALSATTVSASSNGTIYVYADDIAHPKTTFLKKGSNNHLVTDGAACNGKKTLPGTGGALSGVLIDMPNQWDFNGAHDNEIRLGYIKVGKKCLTLTKGHPLSLAACPSFTEEVKVGNKFAWFHDSRSSACWAYGGDADADEDKGLTLAVQNLQTKGKTLNGVVIPDDLDKKAFIGLGSVNIGNAGHTPTGCK
ncbi:hypothetical protein INT43_009075 [Umbelopsis isabellina]|uniref:Uncharacterized protein n=1 Tax=Mortierella isabellina TaxID=91625 RepID=A0A8H7U9F9_MORIS|nr:hypothetical protein INT43_009075 [Umbelopsis isabellina]